MTWRWTLSMHSIGVLLSVAGLCTIVRISLLRAAPAQELEYVSSILWSNVGGARAVGDYAYCGYANGLIVFDISDPDAPVPVSRLYCPGGAGAIHLLGDLAILQDYNWGIRLVDISNPLQPTLEGTFETPGQVFDIYARGKFVYVADGCACDGEHSLRCRWSGRGRLSRRQ